MEPDDEEVDVIFEDSVLHQALVNYGFESLETEPKAKIEENDRRDESIGSDTEDCSSDYVENIQSSLLARLVFSSDILNQIHHYHRHQTLQRLMSSKLLTMEDKHFLQDFVEDPPPALNPQQEFTVWTGRVIGLFIVLTIMLNLTPAATLLTPWISLYLDLFPTLDVLPDCCNYMSIILIDLGWLCVAFGLSSLLKKQLQRELIESAQHRDIPVRQLESEAWELLHLEKKCLRLLRESELVARGFTLATQQHASFQQTLSQKSAVDKLCPRLRFIMLTQNAQLLTRIKDAVGTTMKSVAMRVSDSDFTTMEDLSEQDMLLFTKESTQDVIPMAPISKSVNLLQIYTSGCMRKLAMCFFQKNLKDPTLNPFDATLECVQSCMDAIAQAHKAVKEHHLFYRANHRSRTLRNRNDDPKVSRWIQGGSSSVDSSSDKLQHFYVCVNSLDLHLQSVMMMTRDLSSILETHLDKEARQQLSGREVESDQLASSTVETGSVDKEGARTTIEDWTSWEDTIKRVKVSLDSVHCCYEECIKHLSQKDKSTEKQAAVVPNPSNACVREKEHATVKVIPAEDPVIEDQVFEAEPEDAIDVEAEEEAEWRRQRQEAAQARTRIQEQRETMKRLRQELGAVVAQRAVIHREREERALARARGEVVGKDWHNSDSSQTNQGHTKLEDIWNTELELMKDVGTKSEINGCKGAEIQDVESEIMKKSSVPGLNHAFAYKKAENVPEEENSPFISDGAFELCWHDKIPKEKDAVKPELLDEERKMEEIPRTGQVEKGSITSLDIISKKGFSEVHQLNHRHQNLVAKHDGEDNNIKSGKKELSEDKPLMLNHIQLKLIADPSIESDLNKKFTDAKIVPGGPYSAQAVCSNDGRISIGVGRKECLNKEGKLSTLSKADKRTVSDSPADLKKLCKRPAPPRVCKRRGEHYVTPVNLITMDGDLQGHNISSGKERMEEESSGDIGGSRGAVGGASDAVSDCGSDGDSGKSCQNNGSDDKPPLPSPDQNSSLKRAIAEMAAAHAHHMQLSPTVNFLGGEEIFGDDSSSEDEDHG